LRLVSCSKRQLIFLSKIAATIDLGLAWLGLAWLGLAWLAYLRVKAQFDRLASGVA